MFQGIVDMPCPREPSTRHFLAWVLLEITETRKSHWHCQRRWRRSDIEQRGINLWLTRFFQVRAAYKLLTSNSHGSHKPSFAHARLTSNGHCTAIRMLRVNVTQGTYHKYFYRAPVLSLVQLQGRLQQHSHPRHHPRPYCPHAPRFTLPPP